jgi:hypothetical protein
MAKTKSSVKGIRESIRNLLLMLLEGGDQTWNLAEHLKKTRGAVYQALVGLRDHKWVTHDPKIGWALTPKGLQVAQQVAESPGAKSSKSKSKSALKGLPFIPPPPMPHVYGLLVSNLLHVIETEDLQPESRSIILHAARLLSGMPTSPYAPTSGVLTAAE